MKVIDFDEEESQIKRDIEKARKALDEVEDLSDLPDKNHSNNDEKMSGKDIAKDVFSVIINVVICFAVVFLITNYVGQRTVVSGSSMEDTLSDGDNLIVDKISYKFHDPERFDVVIFPYDEDNEEGTYFIKRIIGLPGETVYIDASGNIYIDGEILDESYGTEVINRAGLASTEITLGDDEYFVLGDNRNNSTDSRIIGNIKREEIVGKAWLRIYPFSNFGLVDNLE